MIRLACAYTGIRLRMNLRKRVESLADIRASLELLEGEINFSVNKLKTAFTRADRNGLFALAGEKIDTLGADMAWRAALDEMKTRLCLTDADADILKTLGARLGRTDTDDQIKNIRYVKTLAARCEEESRAEYERFAKLYSSGGILIGLFIVIMLI